MCGFVVAGLGLEVAVFEDAVGADGQNILRAIAGAHKMYSLCA